MSGSGSHDSVSMYRSDLWPFSQKENIQDTRPPGGTMFFIYSLRDCRVCPSLWPGWNEMWPGLTYRSVTDLLQTMCPFNSHTVALRPQWHYVRAAIWFLCINQEVAAWIVNIIMLIKRKRTKIFYSVYLNQVLSGINYCKYTQEQVLQGFSLIRKKKCNPGCDTANKPRG